MVALLQVQCLEEVVRTKSFRNAAQALHMSQPAVSGHIARLERELHLTLLTRGSSGSILTPDGVRILPHLRAFVESAELIRRASEEIQDGAPQTLTIVGETRRLRDMLPDTLGLLRQQFEHLTVRIESCSEEEMYTALRSGHADIGVMAMSSTSTCPDDIVTNHLIDLGPTGVAAAAGCDALGTHMGPIEASQLFAEPLIIVAEHKLIGLVDRYFPPETRLAVSVVDDVGLGLNLVQRGMGIMVASSLTTYLANPRVDWRALAGAPNVSVQLAWFGGEELGGAARDFVGHLTALADRCDDVFHYNAETGQLDVADVVRRWNGTLVD